MVLKASDPFYRLLVNVQDAEEEESEEILSEINRLSDDDLEISSSKTFLLETGSVPTGVGSQWGHF